VLPNEKREFSAGWRAAQKGGPAGCTIRQASGLYIKGDLVSCTVTEYMLGCGKVLFITALYE